MFPYNQGVDILAKMDILGTVLRVVLRQKEN
jgi:hypothetical protein